MTKVALGVDLGGTNLRAAVVADTGTIIDEVSHPTQAEQGPDRVLERIAAAIDEVATRASVSPSTPVGVAAPGPLDPRTGVVGFAPNLPGWIDIPLTARLEKLTGRKIYLGNDANAAALGELYFGAGRGSRNLVYIGLGTGVGGGVISDGLLIDGAHGMGGELGHLSVAMDGPRCTCGSTGCIESYCSAWAISRDAALLVASGRGKAISEAAGDRPPGSRAVATAAGQGDPDALQLLERAGRALGAGLGNCINMFNPEIIVIGGGVSQIGAPLLDPARRAMTSFSIAAIHRGVRLVPSELGTKSGTFGSAALVFYAER